MLLEEKNGLQVGRGMRGECVMWLPNATQQGTRCPFDSSSVDIQKRMLSMASRERTEKLKMVIFFFHQKQAMKEGQ